MSYERHEKPANFRWADRMISWKVNISTAYRPWEGGEQNRTVSGECGQPFIDRIDMRFLLAEVMEIYLFPANGYAWTTR